MYVSPIKLVIPLRPFIIYSVLFLSLYTDMISPYINSHYPDVTWLS